MFLNRKLNSIGELVDFADYGIPFADVTARLFEFARRAEELHARADPDYLRCLVIVGALANRALFEVEGLAKDRAFLLGSTCG